MRTREDIDKKAIEDLKRAKSYIVITDHGMEEDSGGTVYGDFHELMALYITIGARLYSMNSESYYKEEKEKQDEANKHQ